MKKIVPIIALLAIIFGCKSEVEKFEVSGTVEGAEKSVLYLDAVTLRGVETIDSVKLGSDGTFALHGQRPNTPEFYRLRLGDEIVNLCIDSTETVKITAQKEKFATTYKVEGSEGCEQMRELSLMQLQLRRDVEEIARRDGMSPSQRQEAILTRIEQYKDAVCQRYIVTDPGTAVAYYALFHTFSGQLVFDPVNNRSDVRWFAAVATAWDNLWPDAERTQNLHNVALTGMANTRGVKTLPIDYSTIEETGIIDMTLENPDGKEISLSSLKGKVVLLDFTAYATPEFAARTLALRELYNKYADRGFEIYQVSVDEDLHLWSMRAAQLPWIGVHLGAKADILTLYRVSSVPTFFLIDRGSNLVSRDSDIADLEKAIQELL